MSLKTYDRPTNIEDGSFRPWNVVLVEGQGDPNLDVLKPGDWVTDRTWGGYGIVVAVNDAQLTVLWSKEPDLSRFMMPNVRRVNMTSIAKEIVKVQPMTAPSSLIFYGDHVYGKKEGDEAGPDATPEEGDRPDRG